MIKKSKVCYLCGGKGDFPNRRYDIPGIIFQLKGFPLICDQCMFRKITGKKLEWEVGRKENIIYDEKIKYSEYPKQDLR